MQPYVKNPARFRSQVDAWFSKVEKEAENVARGLTAELLTVMVKNSPQWTGDFASNWRYAVNTIDYSYDVGDVPPKPGAPEPYMQFDRPAVQLGLAKNSGKELTFKLGDTVYISNSSTHDHSYAQGVFDGSVKLREVNRQVALTSVLADFNNTYGRTLDPSLTNNLKGKRI